MRPQENTNQTQQEIRVCRICGEEIEPERPSNATLCRRCARGNRPRTCDRCSATFRGTATAQYCPKCRAEIARESRKKAILDQDKTARQPPQVPVKKVSSFLGTDTPGIPTPATIQSLRESLQMSQAEFGVALGRPNGRPYSRQYISALERQTLPVTERVRYCFSALRNNVDHLTIMPARVYTPQELPPGTIVLGKPKTCPICMNVYIYPWATQKYCSLTCKREARRRQAQERRRRARQNANRI